jgi:rSAM/selenodomain-associated transferase 1
MNSIIIFARAPEPGKVKTRLAAQIGDEAAAKLYAAMLNDTIAVAQNAARETKSEVVLCYTPDDAFAPGDYSLANFWQGAHLAQTGNDLGEKMLHAAQSCFANGAQRVVIIGSDKPDLEVSTLLSAIEELEKHDLVFGPALDGGFYLIGTRAPFEETLFTDVLWSHESTLQAVLNKAYGLNLSVTLLPLGADVDEESDLQRFIDDPTLKTKAPHFYAALCARNFGIIQKTE